MILYTGFRWGFSGEPQQMLVQDGRVVARAHRIAPPPGAQRVDLGDQWILPRFVDAHCHILATGLDMYKLHLGRTASRDDVLDLVRQRAKDLPGQPLLAVHYDQNRYGGIHLTRDDLDGISAEVPILLTHVNEHASVANSAALRLAGVDESTPDPAGGVFMRNASGRLSGVLLETAHEFVSLRVSRPSPAQMVDAIIDAAKLMAAQGIGCASELMTGYFDLDEELQSYQLAAERGCPIHMRLYVMWEHVFGSRAAPGSIERMRSPSGIGKDGVKDVRVAGVKIFADGAISSGTAAIYGRFQGPDPTGLARSIDVPGVGKTDVDGQLIHSPERLTQMVLEADRAGFQVAIHSIGDYSTDLVLDALELTDQPSRHRIEHTMLLEDRQIERIAKLGVHCSVQPEFLLGLGPSYRRQLGPERAAHLVRCRSILAAGISTSFSSDRPVVAGNPLDGIRAASDRPPGFDAGENCSRAEAFMAYTAGGAAGNGDHDLMGTLSAGSLADFQVFESDPLGV